VCIYIYKIIIHSTHTNIYVKKKNGTIIVILCSTEEQNSYRFGMA